MANLLNKNNKHLFLEKPDKSPNSFIANMNSLAKSFRGLTAEEVVALKDIPATIVSTGEEWKLILEETALDLLAGATAFNTAVVTKITEDVPANSEIVLPDIAKYVVGTNMLMLSYNGTVCYLGEQFEEIGEPHTDSNKIRVLFDLRTDDILEFRIVALNTDVSGSAVIAKDSTELRTLSERFSDIVNVKDFGAKGDSITDDTAAFEAAGATGKAVFVPEGQYVVKHKVDGVFFSYDGVSVPFIDVRYQRDDIAPILTTVKPLEIGGDYPNIYADNPLRWPGATQGHFCDPYDKVLYFSREQSGGKIAMFAIRWSEREEERVLLATSPYEYNKWAHQSNSLYRPNVSCKPLFFAHNNVDTDAGVEDFTQKFKARLLSWDYKNSSEVTVLKNYKLFESDVFDEKQNLQMCVSIDSKYLIGKAVKRTGEGVFRVWDAAYVASMQDNGEIDLTDKYLWETVTEEPYAFGQGIYSDGRFIYGLGGSYTTYITVFTLDGKRCFDYPSSDFRSDIYAAYSSQAEPESLFWAPYYGRLEMFLAISHVVHDIADNPDGWSRYNRYWGLSIAGDCFLANDYAWRLVIDLDEAVEPGYYRFENDASNAPKDTGGYVHVIRHEFNSWGIIQVVYHTAQLAEKTRREVVFVRSGKYDVTQRKLVNCSPWTIIGINAWRDTGKGYHVFAPTHGNQEVGQTSSSYEMMRLYHFRDLSRDPTGDSYGFISRFVNNTAPNNTPVKSHMRFGVNEGGRGGIPFVMESAQMTDEAGEHTTSSSAFSFYQDAKANLGSATYRWAQLFAATDSINTSDAREKTAVSDPNEALMRAWSKVSFKSFQFTNAVEKKGEEARIHFGVIAQQVAEAFASEGLDASCYALFCYDKWDDEYEDVEVMDVKAVLDEEGNEVTPAITHIEKRLVTPAGDRYGIRYSEALALECAYQRWLGEKREQRIAALEAKLGETNV